VVKTYKNSKSHELFIRGIGHKKFKKVAWYFSKEIEIPEEWDVCKGEELFNLTSGYAPSDIIFSETGNLLFVQVDDMNSKENSKNVVNSKLKFSSNDNPKIKLQKENTIIFPKRGVAILKNKVRKLDQKGTVDTNIMMLLCNKKINTDYFLYYLWDFKLKYLMEDAGIPQLNNKDLYPRKFVRPQYLEQQKIANILSNIDSQIKQLENYLSNLKTMRKSILNSKLTQKMEEKIVAQ
jgi:type I restriction enzyme, S subunit